MLNLKKIAVTGGLAAGKTTVCQLFKDLGAYVVSADEITHQLLSPGTLVGQQIVHLLGSEIINGSALDRRKIAAKVFSNPELLRSLEGLIHPAVFDEIDKRYQDAKQKPIYPLFFAEVPLLYEAERQGAFDYVIVVHSSKPLRRERFKAHPHSSSDEFEKRILRQMEPEKKAAQADFVIENDGNFEHLKTQVRAVYSQLNQTSS